MSGVYVGIDNGLDGACVTMKPTGSGVSIETNIMPVLHNGKGREVDARAVALLAQEWKACDALVAIEQATKHSPGKLALCSTWFSYGTVLACLRIYGVRHHIITSPRTWQKEFWAVPKMAEGAKFDTKAAALVAAQRLFPQVNLLASPRCQMPHDGIVDALLIAEYARRNNL